MTADEQAAFLARSRTVMLTTIDGRSYPHCVAMWFALIDGVVHMTSFRKAQKVVNIRRNPKVSLLAESGSAGDASAPDLLRRQAAKRVAIRIHAERVASWDHSKLRGAY